MTTILDVSRIAGISKSTVLRVLNQPDSVSPEVKDKVIKVIKNIDYSPSYFAQGIRTGRTKTIAMLRGVDTGITYMPDQSHNISNSGGALGKSLFLKNVMGLWIL